VAALRSSQRQVLLPPVARPSADEELATLRSSW
jgi:hypothetical protein